MKALVLVVSDRVAAGVREDSSGALAVALLTELGFATTAEIVADDLAAITAALRAATVAAIDVVISTGGTGLTPRDVTPEATQSVLDRPAPGIAELIRRSGVVPTAALSRGVAGISGQTLIVNLAGSTGAVRDGMTALAPLLEHAVSQLHGGDH